MRIFRTRNSWKHDNIMEPKLGPSPLQMTQDGDESSKQLFVTFSKCPSIRGCFNTPNLYQPAIKRFLPHLWRTFYRPGVVRSFLFFQVRRVIRDECGSEIAVPWYF